MRHHHLTFAAFPGAAAASRAAIGRVLDAWPDQLRRPGVDVLPLSELEARLASDAAVPVPGPIVLAAASEDFVSLCRVVDLMQQRAIPGLVLVEAVTDTLRSLQDGGVLVEHDAAEPAALAGMLHALAERETAVRSLRGERDLAHSCHGGVAGEMTRLHAELNLASAIQRELLPKAMPSLPGVEFAVLFRPASYVSGDIYDFQRLDEHRVGFLLADAVGHGVPAALLTMVLLRSLAAGDRAGDLADPARTLARLNFDLAASQRGANRFATAVYGVIDARTRRITLAGAGHPPPLRIAPGFCEHVETDGPLLGVFPDAEFTTAEFELSAHETLLIHTDGLELAFPGTSGDPGAAFRRLPTRDYLGHLDRLGRAPGGETITPATMMERLGALLDSQTGSLHQADDVTALAIAPAAMAQVQTTRRAA